MMDRGKSRLVGAVLLGALFAITSWGRVRKKHSNRSSKADSLSERGIGFTKPALSYLHLVLEAFANPYHVSDNPGGIILLAVAENKLTAYDELGPPLLENQEELPESIFYYNDMRGAQDFRVALAKFLRERVMPGVAIEPTHICASAGVAAGLSNLFCCIVNPADAVLVPAPYYAAFDADLTAFPRACVYSVRLRMKDDYALKVEELERAHGKALAEGHRPAALLLTNPHNPLGRCMSLVELNVAVAFCEKHRMHLVSDEIYALSTWGSRPGTPPFRSLANVLGGELGDYNHILWGFSKDFGMSGLRVGCIVTQNKELMVALGTASVFTACSLQTQASLTRLLANTEVIDRYLEKNSQNLAAAHDLVYESMGKMGISCYRCNAGMFSWLDLRPLLAEQTWEAEASLMERMVKDYRVALTPGSAQHAEAPGFFRICYAFVQRDTLQYALKLLASLVRDTNTQLKGL